MKPTSTYFFAGSTSITGAILMLIGAAFWVASGTDLWQALAYNRMDEYLLQLPEVRQLLVINTSFWIAGVLVMVTALSLMAGLSRSNRGLAQMSMVLALTGASLGIVSFITMLSLAVVNPSLELATIIGWIGARTDDIATMLIVGFSPLCLVIAGREDWVPGWLFVWGWLAGISGLLVIIALYTGLVDLGFIIIPFGIGWMIAAGVVLVKKRLVAEE